jgi:hypothetical protein
MPHTLKTVLFLLCLSAIFVSQSFTVEGAAVPEVAQKPQKERIRIDPSASVLAVTGPASRVERDASKPVQQPQAGLKDKQTKRRVRSGNLGADINLEGLPPLVRADKLEINICLGLHNFSFSSLFSGYAQVEERTEYDIMVFK